jgi:hypothetical protein
MKFKFLHVFVVLLLLGGCEPPKSITELPKATTIDDYCTGAGIFVQEIAERRDRGDDFDYTKQAVLADAASLTAPSQVRERKKMLEVHSYVYKNASRSPRELRIDIYQTCMRGRKEGTWFSE